MKTIHQRIAEKLLTQRDRSAVTAALAIKTIEVFLEQMGRLSEAERERNMGELVAQGINPVMVIQALGAITRRD